MDTRRAEEDAPIGRDQTDEHLVVSPTGFRRAGAAMLCALLVAVMGMVWLHGESRILGHRASYPSDPTELTRVGDRVFFAASDTAHGRELWVTDGTRLGTHLVKDTASGPGGWVSNLVDLHGILLFLAQNKATGYGLWRSDGTWRGTFAVRPLNVFDMTVAGDRLYLDVAGHAHGHEPWVSDGNRAGTHLLKDIRPGPASSGPYGFTLVGGNVFFQAGDWAHGGELWASDGTAVGTHLVKDIATGRAASWPSGVTDLGGVAYFSAQNRAHGCELWRSDGTGPGTRLVKDIFPGAGCRWDTGPSWLTTAGGRLFFAANDGVHGVEPWTSDGTAQGTTIAKDLDPGRDNSWPYSFVDLGGRAVFTACTDFLGCDPWISDGTGPGTTLVKDIAPGPRGWDPPPIEPVAVGDHLYFFADDAVHGLELWKSDGTGRGTRLVRDVLPGGVGQQWNLWPPTIAGVGNKVFFVADDGVHGSEPWKTDGTRKGTRIIRDVNRTARTCARGPTPSWPIPTTGLALPTGAAPATGPATTPPTTGPATTPPTSGPGCAPPTITPSWTPTPPHT